MKLKYSIGFLIASVVQAASIMLTETFGISSLGANFTATQLIIHILAGQIAGYILLYIVNKLKIINKINIGVIGAIWGIVVWTIILSINSIQGTVNAPWVQGISTVLSSIIAFVLYGIISSSTIKRYSYSKH